MSAAGIAHVERLLGRKVRDASGRLIGRIEEIHAEECEDGAVVKEFLLGPAALWERLGHFTLELPFLRLLDVERHEHCIPWYEMNLDDPDNPRTTTEIRE